jgi:L-ascorbate metabolism protein UlaG (beta-lactamase superfamily)
MKITKYVHSCLLVEMAERTVLFDPGMFSVDALDVSSLTRLDDIFITHVHPDHCDIGLIKALVAKFPGVRITSNPEVVNHLAGENILASSDAPSGVVFFESPHESVEPIFPQPDCIGFHYLDSLSHPGDSHSFQETKTILALPITAPWGSTIKAANLALQLKPQHILPIHDWHWRDEARQQMYDNYERILEEQGITFHKLETGVPVEIEV